MKAGRELDALIAEKVFGSKKPTHKHDRVHLEPMNDDTFCWECFCIYAHGDVCEWVPRKYSAQIADAWLVVEKMEEMEGTVSIFYYYAPSEKTSYWGVKLGYREIYASANTAPLAICLAALKAIA